VRAFIAVIASAVALGGCASQPVAHWTKAGATQDTFMTDRYACLQQTPQNSAGAYNTPMFVSCMSARGYKEDP
jgi:hypothetical protein